MFNSLKHQIFNREQTWPRSTMDSIRVSEALDPRSIRGEATLQLNSTGIEN